MMNENVMNRLGGFWAGIAAAVLACGAYAEAPVATTLAAADAQGFLGEWRLDIQSDQAKFNVLLTLTDVGGQLGGTVDSQMQPEPKAIKQAEITDKGLRLEYELGFGGQSLTLNFYLKRDGDTLSGVAEETTGIFTAPIVGTRKTQEDDLVQGRRPKPTEAKLAVGDKEFKVTFGSLAAEGEDYARLERLADGEIFEYVGSRATKLMTPVDLKFGHSTVKQGNAYKDYPGVYSLWLKKTEGGWNLVFNHESDVWGTQHNPEADAAEVPLHTMTAGAGAPEDGHFLITIEGEPSSAVLKIRWGRYTWTAPFSVFERSES